MPASGPDKKLCGAKTPKGKYDTCHRVAGQGTTHVGYGHCNKHGGSTPTQVVGAEIEIAQEACHRLGVAVATNPFDSLMQVQAEQMGYVEYFRRLVQELDPDAVFVRPTSILRRPLKEEKGAEDPGVLVEEITTAPHELNVAIKEHKKAMIELRDTSKVIAALGLAEAMVRYQAKRSGEAADLIRDLVTGFSLKLEDDKVRKVIEKVLKKYGEEGR